MLEPYLRSDSALRKVLPFHPVPAQIPEGDALQSHKTLLALR